MPGVTELELVIEGPSSGPKETVIGHDYLISEGVDLRALYGIYVSPEATGVRMWCGYCCSPLHADWRHTGELPFITLLVKIADIHREVECPNPQGPFVVSWHPRHHPSWEK